MRELENLIISIGNTTVQWARTSGEKLLPATIASCATQEFTLKLENAHQASPLPEFGRLTAASVVPAIDAALTTRFTAEKCHFITAESAESILDFNQVHSATLGADRIANAVAAATEFPPPVVVVDCGTAITIEAVDERRRFHSVAIMPGRLLQRRALHEFTGKLPLADILATPSRILAETTENAICNGCDRGILGAVENMLESLKMQVEFETARILITGGDGAFLAENLNIRQTCTHHPLLTLQGIAALAPRC